MIASGPTIDNLRGYIEAVLELLCAPNYVPWFDVILLESPSSLEADLAQLYPETSKLGWTFVPSSREDLERCVARMIRITRFQVTSPSFASDLNELERTFQEEILKKLDALIDLKTAVIEHTANLNRIPHGGTYFFSISNKGLDRTVIVTAGDED